MSSHSPSLLEVLDLAMTRRLGEVHTALPARVEAFDADKQTADLLPQVQSFALQEDGTEVAVTLPVLSSVPVIFPGGGGYRSTFPLAKGDTVLVVFAEASLDAWQARGGVVDPEDRRRHHIADAVAIAGLHDDSKPWTGVATNAATWGKDGGPQVVARAAGLELGADAASPPTDALVLGTSYRSAEDACLQSVSGAVTTMNTEVATAIASLAPFLAPTLPLTGSALAPIAKLLGVIASQLAVMNAALTTYKSTGAGAYLSQVVKTK